jgi:DNA-binding IclR family transcriptional regulator
MPAPPDSDAAPPEDAQDAPEVILLAALVTAPPKGATVPDLMAATGMSRPWIYLRLRDLTEQGHVIQVSRGRWRASLTTLSDCLCLCLTRMSARHRRKRTPAKQRRRNYPK